MFATLRDLAGFKEVELSIPDDSDVRGFKDQLGRDYPNLKVALETVLISVNRQYAFDEDVIPTNGELALFPPVSGG